MSTLTDFSNGLSAAVEKAGASTLLVDGRRRYPASGIAFAADLVLTADHVITREDNLSVAGADGKALTATLAGRDPGSDLAVLRLSEKTLTPARIADSLPKIAALVLALGRPNKAGMQASWGIVTAIGGPARTGRGGLLDEYIQTETVSYPGFSGGPLVNTEGEVLGTQHLRAHARFRSDDPGQSRMAHRGRPRQARQRQARLFGSSHANRGHPGARAEGS